MLSKCCCCVPLRTGSIVLGVLGLLGGFGNFLQAGGSWAYIILGIFYLIAYGALLFGAIKYNDKAVLVNLVVTAIIIVLGVVFAIIILVDIEVVVPEFANNCAFFAEELGQAITVETCDQLKALTGGGTAAVYFFAALLNSYFWVCNYSFFKELKGGSANPA